MIRLIGFEVVFTIFRTSSPIIRCTGSTTKELPPHWRLRYTRPSPPTTPYPEKISRYTIRPSPQTPPRKRRIRRPQTHQSQQSPLQPLRNSLAQDRYNPLSHLLAFWAPCYKLHVDAEAFSLQQTLINQRTDYQVYDVRAKPESERGVSLGKICLSRAWREERGERLDFVVVARGH